MSPGRIQARIVAAKSELVERMLAGVATLPLESEAAFLADPHMVAAGESYLRRALEALLDLGRHLLAKGFGVAAVEYKAVPRELRSQGVLDEDQAARLTAMAGYRNRLVHVYEEVTPAELYRILTTKLGDVTALLAALRVWLAAHPERLDDSL